MHLTLARHPTTPSPALGVTVDLCADEGRLTLSYALTAPAGAILIPHPVTAARTDGLWRRTCFEAFAKAADGEAYIELNLSPSGEWAAYRFDAYRAGMAPLDIPAPQVEVRHAGDRLVLDAVIDLCVLPADGPWRVGLSAVVEAADGSISYWALAHPPGKPDFHHSDCFALELPAGRPRGTRA